jgi:hypothetical protein
MTGLDRKPLLDDLMIVALTRAFLASFVHVEK